MSYTCAKTFHTLNIHPPNFTSTHVSFCEGRRETFELYAHKLRDFRHFAPNLTTWKYVYTYFPKPIDMAIYVLLNFPEVLWLIEVKWNIAIRKDISISSQESHYARTIQFARENFRLNTIVVSFVSFTRDVQYVPICESETICMSMIFFMEICTNVWESSLENFSTQPASKLKRKLWIL